MGQQSRRSAEAESSESRASLKVRARLPHRERKPINLDALNGHVGYFLRRLQVVVFREFLRTLAEMNVRPAQYSVLVLIGANPGRSQAEIGEVLNIERARLARLLHELQRRDWIQRLASTGDLRSHSLFLTNEGTRALARIKMLAARHEMQVSELLGAKRRKLLIELLQAVP